ncbi:indole-3-glycerol phosphate synthase TrpC [Hippea alviniae]|uniref:indole-3-glycerol phosphate synthase TrpC n=1 Tax=Hippea alviniae TaxID=1279027 RepID=UPI0003B72735|nr:indole-3-glycerol-phosphate synthase [Hippea alviniae]
MSLLNKIIESKKEEIKKLDLSGNREGEIRKLKIQRERVNIIAEIKPRSPSAGFIRNIELDEIIKVYNEEAIAISILTDEKFFGGSFNLLKTAKEKSLLPLLCKDFIIDEKQILKAYLSGADLILLIARIVDFENLREFYDTTLSLGMDAIVEIFDEEDLKKVEKLKSSIVGVNSRNLDTLEISIEKTKFLLNRIDFPCIKIAESGIKTRNDIELLKNDCDAFLIGETLLKSKNIKEKFKELKGEG